MASGGRLSQIDWDRWLPWVLVAVGVAQAVLQIQLFTEIRYDDAQLIDWAARPQFGNLDQPTMLSNIAWACSNLGLSPEAFIKIARQVLVVAALLLLHQALRHWTDDTVIAWIGALAITLIDDIRGKAVTEFTHFTFVVCTLAAALLVVTLLIERKSLWRYVLLGLVAALVFHSKYNGTLFFIVLLICCLYDPTAHKAFIDARALISAAIFAALTAPAMVWAYLNRTEVESTFGKYQFDAKDNSPFVEALDAFGSSLTSVAIVAAIAFAVGVWATRRVRPRLTGVAPAKFRMLGAYCATFIIATIIVAMAVGVGEVGRRWVIPGTLFMAVFGGLLAAQLLPKEGRPALLVVLVMYWVGVNVWLLLRYL